MWHFSVVMPTCFSDLMKTLLRFTRLQQLACVKLAQFEETGLNQ